MRVIRILFTIISSSNLQDYSWNRKSTSGKSFVRFSQLTKRVVLSQKETEEEDTVYQTTKKAMDKYGIEIDKIAEMRKSELKKMVKEAINKEMENDIRKAATNMTKLRFTTNYEFKRKEYVNKMGGFECIHTLKTRLNMLPVFANFKGDMTKEKICLHCRKEEDNTEHLVECKQLGDTILKKEDIYNDDNPSLWRLINERTQYNLNSR